MVNQFWRVEDRSVRRRFARVVLCIAACAALLMSGQQAPATSAATAPPTPADAYSSKTGFGVTDLAIWSFVQQHGGLLNVGLPISNVFTIQNNKIQMFEKSVIQVSPNGAVATLPLASSDYLPLAAVLGATNVPDPKLVASLPPATAPDFLKRASTYVDQNAPNVWNGVQVGFGTTFRANVPCTPAAGQKTCDAASGLNLSVELWGLPVSAPISDTHNPDLTYLWFQKGILVHSKSANQNQWLLLGQLFKSVILGTSVAPELLAQVAKSPTASHYYAQYEPMARNGLARPNELPDSSLLGAFDDPATANAQASVSAAAASAAASARPNTQTVTAVAPAPAVTGPLPVLDNRFGVAEGFRDANMMAALGAGWERIVIPWDAVQPKGAGDFSQLGLTMPADRLQEELKRGVKVSAVLQFTPAWAQANPNAGQRSVPRNLNLAYDDPNNYWGQFVYQTVKKYAGQIDEWILWNEPDFQPGDPGAGGSYTWAGTEEDFAQLMRVGYLAAKKANPQAVVSFPATSYWVEELSTPKRTPFYDRVLSRLAKDQRAGQNNFYHDAVSINLYRSPDDVYRVADVFRGIQRKYGLDGAKQLWLTEMNATPSEDAQVVCGAPVPGAGVKTSLDEQASYAIQGFALAAAAGYRHAEVYKMVDGDACNEPAWGLVRGDGSRRPIADATKVAMSYFSNFLNVRFAPLMRDQERWPSWPNNPASYTPNWQVYNVALDRPGNQRVSVLWNGDGTTLRVKVPKSGTSARVVDRRGVVRAATERDGAWLVELPGATAQFSPTDGPADPDGYHFIGGAPLLLVEDGVNPAAPVTAPRLA